MLPYVFTNIPNQRVEPHGRVGQQCRVRAVARPQQPAGLPFSPAARWKTWPTSSRWTRWSCSTGTSSTPPGRRSTAHSSRQAAEMIEWKKLWHPTEPDRLPGPVKRGLGIGVGTWGGMGHPSQCRATIHPDGSVEVEIASQDLGHRHAHHHRDGGGRDPGPGSQSGPGENRRQRSIRLREPRAARPRWAAFPLPRARQRMNASGEAVRGGGSGPGRAGRPARGGRRTDSDQGQRLPRA